MRVKKTLIFTSILVLLFSGCSRLKPQQKYEYNEEDLKSGNVENYVNEEKKEEKESEQKGITVSDPALYYENESYYLFGSNMISAKSNNLKDWDYISNGYQADNSVYGNLWVEDLGVFDYAGSKESFYTTDDGGEHVWKPSIIYNGIINKYMLYYCTSSNWEISTICFGLSDKVDGVYQYEATILYSGFDKNTMIKTNLYKEYQKEQLSKRYLLEDGTYNYNVYPNAISPYVFWDKNHELWMVYGSKLGGIYLLPLNKNTGLPKWDDLYYGENVDPYYGYHILGGDNSKIEEPSIIYNTETGYYYLFVSYGTSTREGGYQIRVLRSENVQGPYVDNNNKGMNNVYDNLNLGLKLSGNYRLTPGDNAYMSTGSSSIYKTTDGKYLLSYQTRFEGMSEYSEPRIKEIVFNEKGWPLLMPYSYESRNIAYVGYTYDEVKGSYYLVNSGSQINSTISEPEMMKLEDDSVISGEHLSGKWFLNEETNQIIFMLHQEGQPIVTYEGIFREQYNEQGELVMTFTAVGNNRTIWGVKQ